MSTKTQRSSRRGNVVVPLPTSSARTKLAVVPAPFAHSWPTLRSDMAGRPVPQGGDSGATLSHLLRGKTRH
jgi:hypothetical protein